MKPLLNLSTRKERILFESYGKAAPRMQNKDAKNELHKMGELYIKSIGDAKVFHIVTPKQNYHFIYHIDIGESKFLNFTPLCESNKTQNTSLHNYSRTTTKIKQKQENEREKICGFRCKSKHANVL
jgi:hypothetical protein